MDIDNEIEDHWIARVRKILHSINRTQLAASIPISDSEYIRKYGIMYFDIKNGIFTYGTKRPMQFQDNKDPYKLMLMLFSKPGEEVTYKDVFKALNLLSNTNKEIDESREKVKHILKNIRASLKINAKTQPALNPFKMTGKGIHLSYIK